VANPNNNTGEDWELELTKAIARRLPGLDREIFRPSKTSVLVDAGLSVRPWRGRYLAVAKGLRVDGGGAVVCFGAGDTVLSALRNCSAACQKGEWKRDQFASPIGDRFNHVSQDRPSALGVEGYNVGGDFQPPPPLAK
jgi:hypothetical protein